MHWMYYEKNSMNMKDNTDRFLEAMEHPELFSDAELATLFEDSETRKLYDTMSKAANLLTETTDADIDVEWNRFVHKHRKRRRPNFLFERRSAIVVATIVVSLAVVSATIGISHSLQHPETSEIPVPIQHISVAELRVKDSEQPNVTQDTLPTPKIKVFKEENFEQLINQVAEYYGASVTFRTSTSKTLRLYFKWNQSQSLSELVEQLNSFAHINIVLYENILIIE